MADIRDQCAATRPARGGTYHLEERTQWRLPVDTAGGRRAAPCVRFSEGRIVFARCPVLIRHRTTGGIDIALLACRHSGRPALRRAATYRSWSVARAKTA